MDFRMRRALLATISLLPLCSANPARGDDKAGFAVSAIEFGGSVSKLLWVSVRDEQQMSIADADQYKQLAQRVRAQIDLGRSSSELITANLNLVAGGVTVGAAADPEPLSKAITGVAAWGAKKTGETIGRAVLSRAEDQGRMILAQGLKESGLSSDDLRAMGPEQLRSRVADLQVGGAKLRDALRDVPGALDMLQAQSIDLATNLGVEAIARSNAIGADVSAMKKAVAQTMANVNDYQKAVNAHMDRLESGLNQLQNDTAALSSRLDTLRNAVQGNTVAIQSLATISYAGWSTSQKLQAVQSGLSPT
jgi:hypothetical protein